VTTRERIDTEIVRKVYEHFKMLEADTAALSQQITKQLIGVYKTTIQSQLVLYSCQKLATGPDAKATDWINEKAQKDSEGITATYNRELLSKVRALHSENRRGNRFFYLRALDAWILQRNAHKIPSISLNTMTSAKEYAANRFRDENGIEGKFIFAGPPPVCKKCMRLKALGLVSAAQAKRYGNSQHVNCPHFWQAVTLGKLECETAWTG
jgi:hypothetical protein